MSSSRFAQVSYEIQKIASRKRITRFFTAEDDRKALSGLIQQLNQVIQMFTVRIMQQV